LAATLKSNIWFEACPLTPGPTSLTLTTAFLPALLVTITLNGVLRVLPPGKPCAGTVIDDGSFAKRGGKAAAENTLDLYPSPVEVAGRPVLVLAPLAFMPPKEGS
jgi:hypothetical protein